MRLLLVPVFVLGLMGPAAADTPPPEGSIPLSQIVQEIEQRENFHFIDEIDLDDDGYYEIEYHTRDGQEVEVEIDARTGEAR